MRRCQACLAQNEDDADFCDQCASALGAKAPEPGDGPLPGSLGGGAVPSITEVGDGCCPDCGGEVHESEGGKGVCKDCGAELAEEASAASHDPEPSESPAQKLGRLIKGNLASGMPLDAAIEAGCNRFFYSPDAEEKKGKEGGLVCPVCGEGNPPEALQCGSCAILFESPSLPAECPVCSEKSTGGQCSCGAVLTLPKLAGLVDDSVEFVCPHCKTLYTAPRTECGDCGNSPLLPADRLKEHASKARSGS